MTRAPTRSALRAAALILAIGAAAAAWEFGYPQIQIRRAERALAQGRLREAESILTPMVRGGDARAVAPLARVLFRQGRARAVIALLLPRREAGEQALLGEAWLLVGDEGRALDAYRTYCDARPDEVEAPSRLASLTARRVGPAQALDLYGRLEDLDPENPDWPLTRGQIALAIDRYETAVGAFRSALRLVPDRIEVRFALAEAEFLAGDLRASLAELDRCVAREPSELKYALARAECLHALGMADRATLALEAILARTPEDAKALRLRAELHLERSEPDRAVGLLERARDLDPDDWRVRYQLARAYEALDRPDEARAEIEVMQRNQQADLRHD